MLERSKAMKKTISIYFSDTLKNTQDTDIYKWLCQRYTVVVDPIHPDFLFYDIFGDDYKRYSRTQTVKIFVPTEDETANFNECDYAAGFARLNYAERYFRRCADLEELDASIQDRSCVSEQLLNRKFCNFIYSNPYYGEGALLRQKFCQKLMEYKRVDCPGRVLNNMDRNVIEDVYFNDWRESKRRFQAQYKFTIAFENDATDGWVTEKMPDAMRAFSLPIYYGDCGITKDFNPKSFINSADFNHHLDKLVEKVIELDKNDEAYLAMLREQPMQPDFRFDGRERFKQWIFDIIEKGRAFNKDPRDISRNKTRMRAIKDDYRAQHGIKEDFSFPTVTAAIPTNDLRMFLNDYKSQKYCFKKWRYELLSKILWGKLRQKYKEKYQNLKKEIWETK